MIPDSFRVVFLKVLLIISIVYFFSSCKSDRERKKEEIDRKMTELLAAKALVLDSTSIDDFLRQFPSFEGDTTKIKTFYENRAFESAWFYKGKIIEQAGSFMNMLQEYDDEGLSDKVVYLDTLTSLFNMVSDTTYQYHRSEKIERELDLLLTAHFFEYARKVWYGMGEDVSEALAWHLPRKNLQYVQLLDSLLNTPKDAIAGHEPVYKQYNLLKKYLRKYRDIEKKGGFPQIISDKKTLKLGDTNTTVIALRKYLLLCGDLDKADTSQIFDETLDKAVKVFQQRLGLKNDGVIGQQTITLMNIPVRKKIEQIILNMERCRWVPDNQTGDYLTVNIPEFKLHAYQNSQHQWSMNVVVGSTNNNTVIFNGEMETVIFAPYWYIPPAIFANETLPAIKRNSYYLSRLNMEVVNPRTLQPVNPYAIAWWKYKGTDFPYLIRQRPGLNNALGQVVFLFPNNYNIYLHDTPAKSAFGETSRAFSHGCIRVSEPQKLAEFVLKSDSTWNKTKIYRAMNYPVQQLVPLKKKIPVFIAYFTAWVDETGRLNLREDIYGHDARLSQLMFAKAV
jgi:murein L,D-transpeptidase YcbB/YkuD